MNKPRIAVEPKDFAPYRYQKICEVIDASGGVLTNEIAETDGVIWLSQFDVEVLRDLLGATSAKWIQLPWAGVEQFVEAGIIDDTRQFTCAKGAYAPVVAEHALALLLAGFRRVHDFARTDSWLTGPDWGTPNGDEDFSMYSLFYSHVVIVGGGGIATELIKMLKPFGTKVTVVRKHPQEMADVAQVFPVSELSNVLPEADAVVLALPATPDTKQLIGADQFAVMKPTSWLINVGRGSTIDTAALVRALENRMILGVAIDVTDPEPLPDDHPIWGLDNVLITPHVADNAIWVTNLLAERVGENIKRFANGEPLLGLVDANLGY